MDVAPIQENVFQATGIVLDWKPDLSPGMWYFVDATWKEYMGPYGTEAAAKEAFKLYVTQLRACPSCGE